MSTPADRDPDAPLVSCLMPTADRRQFVPGAIDCFLRQTYPHRELIVVDDGEDPVADLMPSDDRVRYVRLAHHTVLGSKRNIAAETSNGDVLAHWDDDDWSRPDRLSSAVIALHTAVDVCGLDQLLWYEPAAKRAWRYRYRARRPWLAGNTLVYRRKAWQRAPFQPLAVGEDTAFIRGPGHFTLRALDDESLVIGTIHEHNTASRVTRESSWSSVPVDEIHRIKLIHQPTAASK